MNNETGKLAVIYRQCSDELHNSDDICMLDWYHDKTPTAYFGAWTDSFDFLEENPYPHNNDRWFFLFNRVPASREEVEEAIADLYDDE